MTTKPLPPQAACAGCAPVSGCICAAGGRDANLPAPEQFNPDASMFDIYGNKNGDWNQSALAFSWKLADSRGNDVTALLSNPGSQHACLPYHRMCRPEIPLTPP